MFAFWFEILRKPVSWEHLKVLRRHGERTHTRLSAKIARAVYATVLIIFSFWNMRLDLSMALITVFCAVNGRGIAVEANAEERSERNICLPTQLVYFLFCTFLLSALNSYPVLEWSPFPLPTTSLYSSLLFLRSTMVFWIRIYFSNDILWCSRFHPDVLEVLIYVPTRTWHL